MDNSIREHQLENGLKILLKEIHTAPIVSHWVWYRVGSRYETPGLTGISHWVEHMQFKGTDKFPAGSLDREISRVGGLWNAMTYLDWTTYYDTLPAHLFEIGLASEADRMVNSLFDPKEVDLERNVVISEREGNENQPLFLLGEAIQAEAFTHHPYRHEVIGLMEDLQTITRDDLFNHYRQYYQPGNTVLAIAGDFEIKTMMDKIDFYYGSLPKGKSNSYQTNPEPWSEAEKQVTVSGPDPTSYVQIAYHAPKASDPDFFLLSVLDSVLTGPSSLNMFGSGSTSNKTSRLYRALVEGEISVS
jgi:zinc protease